MTEQTPDEVYVELPDGRWQHVSIRGWEHARWPNKKGALDEGVLRSRWPRPKKFGVLDALPENAITMTRAELLELLATLQERCMEMAVADCRGWLSEPEQQNREARNLRDLFGEEMDDLLLAEWVVAQWGQLQRARGAGDADAAARLAFAVGQDHMAWLAMVNKMDSHRAGLLAGSKHGGSKGKGTDTEKARLRKWYHEQPKPVDTNLLRRKLAELRDLEWPARDSELPDTLTIRRWATGK